MKNENGTKNAANRKKKSNAGKSSLNKKTKKDKKHKSKAASKKKSKKKNGKNATGSYSIKQKFTDGIPRIGVYTIPERKALLARFHAITKSLNIYLIKSQAEELSNTLHNNDYRSSLP